MGDILEKYCKKLEKEKEELFEDNRKVKAELWLYKDNDEYMNKEIERLNNIINELEKWLNERKIVWNITREDRDIDYTIVEVLDKLQELKDSDKE